MLRAGRKQAFREGEVIIQQGVPVEDLFILPEGKLTVWLKPTRGQKKEIAPPDLEEMEEDEGDELDPNVLDGCIWRGSGLTGWSGG